MVILRLHVIRDGAGCNKCDALRTLMPLKLLLFLSLGFIDRPGEGGVLHLENKNWLSSVTVQMPHFMNRVGGLAAVFPQGCSKVALLCPPL